MKRTSLTKHQAAKKGYATAAATVGTGIAFMIWWPLGLIGLGATGFLGYRWLSFRGKWGMRF